MRSSLTVCLLAICLLSAPARALAQEAGSVGLAIGYPASVGVLWQAPRWLGLRPELTLDFTSSETELNSIFGATRASSNLWQASIGVTALLLVRRWDATSFYVAPRYAYTAADTSSEPGEGPGGAPLAGGPGSGSGHTISGSVGIHHTLAPRFALFGEVGLSHDRLTLDAGDFGPGFSFESRTSTTGIRSGAGVVFVF